MTKANVSTLTISTPEGVTFSLPLAGPVTRSIAYFIDLAAMLALLAKTVYPVYAGSEDTLAAARAALAGEMHPLLRRALADEPDDLARALRARQAA